MTGKMGMRLPFAMFRSTLKDEHNRVLIKVKNSCSGPNTNALRESFEHPVDGLFIGMETAIAFTDCLEHINRNV